tara:strand:- start:1194 stop:2162 length:969 start_codon:yes stop_codon:yes gene_type:complete
MFNELIPKTFNDFIFHKDIISKIKNYNKENLVNMLFYGPKSSGKCTLIYAFIKYLYNLDDLYTEMVEYDIKINNNDVKIKSIQSKYHYEFFLYEYGLYDKHVLCNFIKELASSKNIINNGYKLIVLHSIDKLNKVAILALRRIMELFIKSCRFIFTVNQLSKIDDSILSRCLSVRVPYPKNNIDEYLDYSEKILKKTLNKTKIKDKAEGNLFKLNTLIFNSEYINPLNIYVKQINNIIENNNKITFIDEIRKIIYKMHLLDFSPDEIIKKYVTFALNSDKYTYLQKHNIIKQAAYNEYYCSKVNKYFFSLEHFFIYIKSITI